MEDATKEFQIFMSPPRDYNERVPPSTGSKRRVVPVINKHSPPSSTSTFTLNHRKSSIYQAVSGVSFQDTDVYDEASSLKKQNSIRKRRQSCSLGLKNKTSGDEVGVAGARRSRSLTNVKGAIYNSDDCKDIPVPEITHPCTPVILYGQTKGRQSRFTRARDRRRTSSQARQNVTVFESKDPELNNKNPPIKPRRTRSASRFCKYGVVKSVSNENILNDVECLKKELVSIVDDDNYIVPPRNGSTKQNWKSSGAKELDFSVNDTDWQKYDVLVTEKLGTLLKNKEEPEGGYFSLERDEQECGEQQNAFGEAFQQDYCNETIYVSETVKEYNEDNYSSEPSYEICDNQFQGPQLADYCTAQEISYPDDEGLYEEIFIDTENSNFNKSNFEFGVNKTPEKLSITANNEEVTPQTYYHPIIERKENSTVVYIRCNEMPINNESFSDLDFQNASLQNNTNTPVVSDERIQSLSPRRQVDHSSWCGCCRNTPGHSISVSHSASCLQGKPGVLAAKYSLLTEGNLLDEDRYDGGKITINCDNIQSGNNISIAKSVSAVNLKYYPSNKKEVESEFSDLDLDMFAPKFRNNRRKSASNVAQPRPHRYRKHREKERPLDNGSGLYQWTENSYTSPQTFESFLKNSIFNPPKQEYIDDEPLVIREDQIITCITDSSSDDDSEDESAPNSSLWLEAKGDFECIFFKKETDTPNLLPKRRKSKSLVPLPKFLSTSPVGADRAHSHPTLVTEERKPERKRRKRKKEEIRITSEMPERPSRRRIRKTGNQILTIANNELIYQDL